MSRTVVLDEWGHEQASQLWHKVVASTNGMTTTACNKVLDLVVEPVHGFRSFGGVQYCFECRYGAAALQKDGATDA